MMSHDKCGKVVHRPCSSSISSVENLMGTLLSSPCQLRLGVDLSYLGSSLTSLHIKLIKSIESSSEIAFSLQSIPLV